LGTTTINTLNQSSRRLLAVSSRLVFSREHVVLNLAREKVAHFPNLVGTNRIAVAAPPATAMSGLSLQCGDCGVLLRSVEEAQAHAEATSHSNFAESTEAVLNLVCSACGKPCRSQIVRS
jgi:hypothetical protein